MRITANNGGTGEDQEGAKQAVRVEIFGTGERPSHPIYGGGRRDVDRPRRMSLVALLFSAAKILGAAYVGIIVLLYFAQGRIIFPSSREIYRTPAAMGWAYQDVVLEVDGEQTHGWYVPLEDARGTVLFSHGNAGNIADRLESIALLRDFGFNVLAYDYGGYGKSTGKASEQRCYADVRAMWRWLTVERTVPPEQIALFGRSLGAAVTLDLASEVKPAAVIAESAFSSTLDVARQAYPWLPVRFFLKYRFDNASKIGKVTAPILVIHSPEDEVIPFAQGQALFQLAPEPRQFLQISGGHNTGFVESAGVYAKGWQEFLQGVFRPEALREASQASRTP